jgi:hypothetical protein
LCRIRREDRGRATITVKHKVVQTFCTKHISVYASPISNLIEPSYPNQTSFSDLSSRSNPSSKTTDYIRSKLPNRWLINVSNHNSIFLSFDLSFFRSFFLSFDLSFFLSIFLSFFQSFFLSLFCSFFNKVNILRNSIIFSI